MKVAIVRWKQRSGNKMKQRPPVEIRGVTDVGEGPHFIHIFVEGDAVPGQPAVKEVNLHSEAVESITVYEEVDLPSSLVVGADGEPIQGDEVQTEEQGVVSAEGAGATPVVPAIVAAA